MTTKKVSSTTGRYDVVEVGNIPTVRAFEGMDIPEHDQIDLTYDGSNNLTVVAYSLGGRGVATLSLTYSGTNLVKVTLNR